MSVITIENLTKRFGDVTAVENANFEIDDQEFVSILGPSGSGKSTILRMIAGFESPTGGNIVINGEPVLGSPPFERDVNMVFQSLALFPHLTVEGNIEYGLKQQGVKKDERRERVKELLEVVRLSGYEDRQITQLSGGEQQRVALARAIVNEPEVVLFDEPLASLDRKLRQHMKFELQRIQAETGITFLYVTHDQDVAMSVSDRLILLNDGEIEQIGTAEELYNEPTSQFVANFIGDVNTVPSTVTDASDSELVVDTGASSVAMSTATLNGHRQTELDTSSDLDVCVRPHDVELRTSNADANEFAAHGTIRNRMYQGEHVVYVVETAEWGEIHANSDSEEFDIGDEVYVTWDASNVYLFPEGADRAGGGV